MAEETKAALSPEEETAAMLYSVYRLQVGGVTDGGLAMPGWADLSIPLHNAWMAVAEAARGGTAPAPGLWTQEDLEQLTVAELRDLCAHANVSVSSSATKQQIIDALLAYQGGTP